MTTRLLKLAERHPQGRIHGWISVQGGPWQVVTGLIMQGEVVRTVGAVFGLGPGIALRVNRVDLVVNREQFITYDAADGWQVEGSDAVGLGLHCYADIDPTGARTVGRQKMVHPYTIARAGISEDDLLRELTPEATP